jgi:hypothetical protein
MALASSEIARVTKARASDAFAGFDTYVVRSLPYAQKCKVGSITNEIHVTDSAAAITRPTQGPTTMTTKISYCEVSLDPRRPQLGYHDTSIEEMATSLEDLTGPWLRVYARDKEEALSVRFATCMHEVMRHVAQPESALREVLASHAWQMVHEPSHVSPIVRSHYFVYDAARSLLEPIILQNHLDAMRRAMATLEATRDYTRQPRFIVECMVPRGETAPMVLIDALWRDLQNASDSAPQSNAQPALLDGPNARAGQPASPAAAARRWREQFLDLGWPTSAEVATRLGSDVVNQAKLAADLRKRGDLLGAWSHRGGTFVHPAFQFYENPTDNTTELRPDLGTLLDVLRELTLDPNGTFVDKGGWRRVFWLYGPRAELDDKTPAEVFIYDPSRVLELAREDLAAAHEHDGPARAGEG